MDGLKKIYESKKEILEQTISWQKVNFPSRTNNYEKCYRDLEIVFDAYLDDLRHESTRNIIYVARRYWWSGKRQIIEYNTEIAVHNFMVDYILKNIIPNAIDENKQKLLELKNILIYVIENGVEYKTYMHMHKYRYIMEYDQDKLPDENIIKQCLYEAWETTPSKQQFMPYTVSVLGPGDADRKEKLYYKSLIREWETNEEQYKVDDPTPSAIEEGMKKSRNGLLPQYLCFKTAPYILLFSQRVEYEMNPFNQYQTDHGWNFEQADDSWVKDPKRKNRGLNLSLIEMGMFSQTFSNLCLLHGIDITHTRCLPTEKSFWTDPEFDFLDHPPQLIMTAGYGVQTRREYYHPHISHGSDHRPDFDKVVKFITENK